MHYLYRPQNKSHGPKSGEHGGWYILITSWWLLTCLHFKLIVPCVMTGYETRNVCGFKTHTTRMFIVFHKMICRPFLKALYYSLAYMFTRTELSDTFSNIWMETQNVFNKLGTSLDFQFSGNEVHIIYLFWIVYKNSLQFSSVLHSYDRKYFIAYLFINEVTVSKYGTDFLFGFSHERFGVASWKQFDCFLF